MKHIIRVWFLLAVCFSQHLPSFAQNDSSFRVLKTLSYPVTSFAVDNIGELYLITPGNQLKKISENGDSIGVFNQVTKYGKLTDVQVQNPWKALLFYRDFATIVMLDKYLNVTGSINLRNKNIFKVNAITTSYDNNTWLYDEQDNKIKKLDDAGNVLMESTDFRRLFDEAISPQNLVDDNGLLYLYDPERGLFIFDYYGSFKRKIAELHWDDFTIIEKKIYGFDANNLYEYHALTNDVTTTPFPEIIKGSSELKIMNHKIYVLKAQQLTIYSMQ
ncbi:MAG: hypothetical protein JSS98_14740 [Bacteroidetes bacterium]|nr:hypothetical protein [Bacteroidota bacterium]